MKTTITLKGAVLTVAIVALSPSSQAGDMTRCDRVFEEVRPAAEMDPPKVHVIVEDAMVANETCACEIVKGAIIGSRANLDLTKQIVLTATHIAPKMAPLIAECADAISPGHGLAETVMKREVGVQPDGVQPPGVEDGLGGEDYSLMPGDIRGVYLIQPSTGGVSISAPPAEDPGGTTTKVVVVKRILPRQSTPQSPSVAQGP